MASSPHSCQRCGQKLDGPARFCPFCGAAQSGTGENPTPSARGPGSAWAAILEKLQLATTPKYDVIRILGYGGMAAVYLAIETRLERKVAIKVMSPGLMIDPHLVERFQQEARTMAHLNHRNIVSIFEIDQKDELHYFAMTYVAGRTLSQVMADAVEPLPIPVVTAWLWQMGNALAYAHQRGIIHRDIKPENILLDADGSALVTDFGIAKVADSPGLTRTGIIVGTPAYMSPEQCSGLSLTGASDQYAMGAVAYQMLVGQPPFVGPTLSVLQAHVNEQPSAIRELRPDCPRDLADAVHQMLQKRPDDRFADMAAALVAVGAQPLAVNDPLLPTLKSLARHAVDVRLDPLPGALAEGERHALGAIAVGPGDEVLADRRIRWSSSDTGVAAVDEDGVLRAIGAGTAEISARSTEATTAAIVTVVPGMVDRVEVVPPETDVSTGEWVQLRPIVRQEGRESEAAVAWSTTDPAIARVTPDGAVEGVNPGSATITATVGGKTGQTIVRVRPAPAVAAASRTAPSRPAPSRAAPVRPQPSRPGRTAASPSRVKMGVAAGAVLVVALGAVAMFAAPWARPDSLAPGDTEALLPPPSGVDDGIGADGADAETGSTGEARDALAGIDVRGPSTAGGAGGPIGAGTAQETPIAVQPPPPAAEPVEAVVPDGRLLIGAALPSGADVTALDSEGRAWPINAAVTSLAPGAYVIRFRAPGYQPEDARVRIRSDEGTRWGPALNPVPAPEPARTETQPVDVPPPVTDPAAERAAAEAAVRATLEGVIAALNRRDVNAALPAFQANARDGWRQLLTAREVQEWSASLADYRLVSMDGGSAEVAFTLRLGFRQSGTHVNQAPAYRGILQGAGSSWRLLYIEPR
ncbi:MAG TPA: protein kinase [Longimicrobiales bacterium]|nr:protein kinase [Longimicrobiales bacterium]